MSEIKLGRCPLCQGETSMLGYIGDDYCKINYEEELEVAKHTTIHCYGCDTDFDPHSENAKDVLVIFNTRKPMERIVKQLEDMSAWKEFMIYDLTAREREIINRAIEIVKAGGVNECS